MSNASKTLAIDPDLHTRLKALAEKSGLSADQFAAAVLETHAEEEEALQEEKFDEHQRWQRYLETGQTVPASKIRSKLRAYAADAAARLEM